MVLAQKKRTITNKTIPILLTALLLLGVSPLLAHAQTASLYLTPSVGTFTTGNTLAITVKVNTSGVAINAAQGTLVFNTDKLAVESISKTGTIFSLWTQDPTFSNSAGTISFGGGVPNPGFAGSAGTIMTITFRARTAGDTTVSFSSGAVLANDGKGTNILSALGGGTYKLIPTTVATPTEPPSGESSVFGGAPRRPIVSSRTHPSQDTWYFNDDATFSWETLSGITATSYVIDKNATTNPSFVTTAIISTEVFPDLEDGIWYFHINFRNQFGWGAITHRRVLIDTTPPKSFSIEVDDRGDATHPQPILNFRATDVTSGINYYEIQVDEGNTVIASIEEVSPAYTLAVQSPGEHVITVYAVDKAGNKKMSSAAIFIEPTGEPPIITKHPSRLDTNDILLVSGESSISDAFVVVRIVAEDGETVEGEAATNESGDWEYTHNRRLPSGLYSIMAISKDKRGALSLPSNEVSVTVKPPAFITFGNVVIDFIATLITLLILLGTLIVGTWYGWYRFSVWRKRLRKETREAERALHSAFDVLHEDLKDQFKLLEKTRRNRKLTKAEEQLHKSIDKNLSIAEKYVQSELKDIEKELR